MANIYERVRNIALGVTDADQDGSMPYEIYLQQIRDAILGVTNTQYGRLNSSIYLQQIRNAISGVPDGQFGTLNDTIYLQQIRNAILGVSDWQFGDLDSGVYWGEILDAGMAMGISGGASNLITLTLQPNETTAMDTWIRSESPTQNNGTNVQLQVGEINGLVGARRSLIKFDLSSLPSNATITSAVLSLYVVTNGDFSINARTFRVYRLKRAWVESQATWNIYSTGNNWAAAGGFHADDCEQTEIGGRAFTATETQNQFKDFILTPITKAALDLGNGWMIKADTEDNDAYLFASSSDATAANRPKLVITYTT
ncbi:MAG: DNRLRE domain-containing protein [Nitrosomonas sp.]|nr:DNRLRE domain-containing protein [Nitrosomonas sp.]